jgi:D-tyrosyl-tRNA(Tyr) deacylase
VLAVSQFTLYADAGKGRRPSYVAAAPGPVAEPVYEAFVAALRAAGVSVETGRFGAMMAVSLVNDGPYTLWLESP